MFSRWDGQVFWRWSALAAALVALCVGVARCAPASNLAQSSDSGANSSTKPQSTADWMTQVKKRVAAHDLVGAQEIVDAELAAAPNDSDALVWRARLLTWTGHRAEAEAAFRRALELSPRDGDCLLGLARLEAQEGHNADALSLLDKALEIPPPRADVYNERGRVLAALQRRKEARADFFKARALEPANTAPADDEAAAGLRSLQGPPRYELDFTNETDTFNYTNAANAQTMVFVAKPNDHWILTDEVDSYQRFGADAQKDVASAAYRFQGRNWLAVGAGGGNAQGVIPTSEAYFEYDRGFPISETASLRGIETTFNQHWFWFQGAHVLLLNGTVAADMADDFRWTFSFGEARSGFVGTPVAWEPTGYTRLEFPLPHVSVDRLLPNVMFAVGSENYAELDQVTAFASRTYGAGFRLGLTERQFVKFYFAWQNRNGGNSEGIYGASYGIRF